MLVTSPHKKEKTKPNVRKSPDRKKSRKGGRTNGTGGNGTSADYGRPMKERESPGRFSLSRLNPLKVILAAVAIGILGILYLNHVLATQQLLGEVQTLEREYNQVRRAHSDLQLTYDRMIGPANIYDRARELGFIDGGPAEKVIEVERDE